MQIQPVSILYIIGTVQAFFFFFLLVSKREKKDADRYLSGFLLVIAGLLMYSFFNKENWFNCYPDVVFLAQLIPLLYGPLLFFYVKSLISDHKLNRKDAYHLIPIALNYLAFVPLIINSRLDTLSWYTEKFMDLPFHVSLAYAIQYFSGPVYFVWIIIILFRYHNCILNEHSNIEKINLKWLQTILIGAILIWLFEIIKMYVGNFTNLPYPAILAFSTRLGFVIFIFFLGYYGLKQGNIFLSISPIPEEPASCRTQFDIKELQIREKVIDDEKSELFEKEIVTFMENEKPYLKGDLRLLDISLQLNIPTHNISYVLNEKMQINFFDFVNTYRVKEAEEKLKDEKNKQYTILGIAYDCGFNSKSSFNRIFKKHIGLTPSEYQKLHFSGANS